MSHKVFISSTSEDLEKHREFARKAVASLGLSTDMMEDLTAEDRQSVDLCLDRVRKSDVVVAIIAHRLGWQPPTGGGKSITRLECEEAWKQGKEVLAFLVSDKADWPPHRRDSNRVSQALDAGTYTSELAAEVQGQVAQLKDFKAVLKTKVCAFFDTPESLQAAVTAALAQWRDRKYPGATSGVTQAAPTTDTSAYLAELRERCSWIDIRGLQVGAGKAHRFPINDLYIPLTMAAPVAKGKPKGRLDPLHEPRTVPLDEALSNPRLVIVGDPGSGKTTFLRRVALQRVVDYENHLPGTPFPIFLRVGDLADHIHRQSNLPPDRRPDLRPDSRVWIPHYLAHHCGEFNHGLSEDFFKHALTSGSAVVLLDGLDEAPDKDRRESIVQLFLHATEAYRKCRFVVTTRPASYTGKGQLPGFAEAEIQPLEPKEIEGFLHHWCTALFPDSPALASQHFDKLSPALRVSAIRGMANNPVMLTALAVVHWNESRLPEQRADLYESVIIWLARSREDRPGRAKAEACIEHLQAIALAMQLHPDGRQTKVESGWAIDILAKRFGNRAEATKFLAEEEADSGIIVSRGASVQFWHLTFQEFLAARAINGMPDSEHDAILRDREVKPEWREVVLLLAGIFRRQGAGRVNELFKTILGHIPKEASLATKARFAGLLGSVVNVLWPYGYSYSEKTYTDLVAEMGAIFDKEKSKDIDFKVRLEAAEAYGQGGDPRLSHDNWIRVEAGPFLMGKEKRKAFIDRPFEIARYPVTVEEYEEFVEAGGYTNPEYWDAGGFGAEKEPRDWSGQLAHNNRPVTGVTWHEASAYCKWANGVLPTDAQWERAARGTDGREYPWGKAEPDESLANYYETGPRNPTPVGMYPAGGTPEGILDMAGNVLEWTKSNMDDTGGTGIFRGLRGGTWGSNADELRAWARVANAPVGWYYYTGLRVARELNSLGS